MTSGPMLTRAAGALPLRTAGIALIPVFVSAHRSGINPPGASVLIALAIVFALSLLRYFSRGEPGGSWRHAAIRDGVVIAVAAALPAAFGLWWSALLAVPTLVLVSRGVIPGFRSLPGPLVVAADVTATGVLLPLVATFLMPSPFGPLPGVLTLTAALAVAMVPGLSPAGGGQQDVSPSTALIGLVAQTVAIVVVIRGTPIGLSLDRSLLAAAPAIVPALYAWLLLPDPRSGRWIRAERMIRVSALFLIAAALTLLAISAAARA